jgi:hypothetical protein
VNFGTEVDTPFVFDVGAMVAAERVAVDASMGTTSLAPGVDLSLVRDFLHREGHVRTLAALDGATSAGGIGQGSAGAMASTRTGWDDTQSLARRAAIRQALLRGDVAAAEEGLTAAHAACPLTPAAMARAAAALMVAGVLECLRLGDALTALELSRTALSHTACEERAAPEMQTDDADAASAQAMDPAVGDALSGRPSREGGHTKSRAAHRSEVVESLNADLRAALVTLAALLPYDLSDVGSLPPGVRHLLGQAQREALADTVNDAILSATAPPGPGGRSSGNLASPPTLVAAMQHLAACQHALRDAQGGQGEEFDISRAMSVKMGQRQRQDVVMET